MRMMRVLRAFEVGHAADGSRLDAARSRRSRRDGIDRHDAARTEEPA